MSRPSDKAARRNERRGARNKDHSQLRLMVAQQQELTRAPTKASNKPLRPLTDNQRLYDAEIFAKQITFGIGPAGTGKTWWAAMRAAEQLKNGEIEKIVVTRPNVEAGETMGFLPGELEEKYEPFFRPVRDALEESFGSGHLEYLLKMGIIEARPLQLIRGATIKNTWLIADEMQNATVGQFKLLLTRIGEDAKFIINGDPTQCDLPRPSDSGLEDAMHRLRHLSRSVGAVTFTEDDIVRSGLCQHIVKAYSKPTSRTPLETRYNDEHNENDAAGLHRLLGVANDGRGPGLRA